jgi:hypothetical protein
VREATVESNRSEAFARSRRAALNWVDYLVIAATILTFLAVVASNNPHAARAQSGSALITVSELPEQASSTPLDPGLLKARLMLGQL